MSGALVIRNNLCLSCVWMRMRAWGLAADVALALGGALGGVYVVACWAPLPDPTEQLAPPGTVILGSQGAVLQRDTATGLRIPVELEQVAPHAVEATIAAEDSRFGSHPGVDPIAITRAATRLPDERSGASTITQQLARRLYLDDESPPLLLRKARESVRALQLEARYSKDEILALYLNSIYYGRGAYGIEAAARVYFGTSAANLDLAQAAMLAGLPQVPSVYDPGDDPGPAKARQRYVLDRMVAEGYASQQEADAAASETLVFLPSLAPPPAPHFTRVVLDELERLRPDLAGQRGLIIETTLDLGLQDEAQRSVSRRLAELDDRDAHNAAVVVIDPGRGAVLAMVGNADFDDAEHAGQVNMALAERQPGSALKPFLYAAALERGYTAASPLLDVPTTFDTADGPYAPQNYDRRFHGIVPLRTALGSSFNVPAVEVLDDIGVDPFLDTLHRFGLTTLTNTETYGLALTLGGGEVRLLDLTAAYGAFAKGGAVSQPFTIARVRDQSGRVLYEHSASPPRPVVSPEDAYIIADILSDPAARTPGFGPSTIFDLPFPAGVKTGTTTAWKDNWTIGFTADRVVGVWVGNADNRPMQGVSGIDGAGPIWRDVMLATAKDAPPRWIERPPGIQEVAVCAPTGLLPGPACPSPSAELFASGTVPTAQEQYYQRGPGGALLVDVPPAARAWAAGAGFALATPASGRESASILQPAPGAILYLAPELDEQRLVLRASVPPGTTAVDFLVDGERAGRTEAGDASLTVPLTPGTHHVQIVASLGDGRTVSASSSYEVRTP